MPIIGAWLRHLAHACQASHGIISLILRHLFSPLNNRRLGHLCGPTDAHLRSIEAALEVRIAHRHEQFKVDGPKAKAQRAMDMLQALYEMAAKPIPDEVVRLMLAGDVAPDAGPGPALATRRADLKPRSVNQAVYLDNIAQYDITIGIGPAGTGKTYLAVAAAVDALHRSAVQRAHAPGGGSGRASGLSARRPEPKGRSVLASAVRRAL